MLMEAGLDTGPILAQRAIPIEAADDCGLLETKLSHLGSDLLAAILPRWLAGSIAPQPQDDSLATTTRLIKKEDGYVIWSDPALKIVRTIRAFTPWPGAFTSWNDQPLKLLDALPREQRAEPGKVFKFGGAVLIGTGEGSVEITQLQAAGKRAMSAADFVRGHPEIIGSQLGVAR